VFHGLQSISCADVADVCVKSLHNPTARNKSFDVSFELQPFAMQVFYLKCQAAKGEISGSC